MRMEAWVFAIVAVFLLIVTPAYWLISREPTGTTALTLCFSLALMITGYLALVARRMDPRPEDRADGEIVEGAGEVGFFPPQSIWPFFCSLTVGIGLVGLVLGWWLMIIAGALGMVSLTGLIYEYYRGDYAH